MAGYRWLVTLVLALSMAGTASATGIFKKQPKPNPATRVPELMNILRGEKNDRKREAAAEELRQYDPRAFPEIVPMLIEIAMNEPSSAVRLEAVQSLGRIRPVSQQAGWALEQVVDKDTSIRVRLQARTLLVQYHLAGYRAGKNPEAPPVPKGAKTEEPPLADPPEWVPTPVSAPMPPGQVKSSANWPAPLTPQTPAYKPLPIPPVSSTSERR
jgi:hypothetical protein